MKFEVGDIVQLKSGGPKMTVASIGPQSSLGGKDYVWCKWFDSHDVDHEEGYDDKTLEKVT